ncbi:hypothetical protein ACH4TX_32535 [Streptomyces sp. NPDC021098]|uniref:hypothetical protein n=1 Tax=unclassified Streptomyces TaxID=2593676 RepID=UPI00379D25A0
MRHLPRAAALAVSALLALTACSGGGSDDAGSAAGKGGKDEKKGTSSSGAADSKATPSKTAAKGSSDGASGTTQPVTSKVEVSIKSCQIRDAAKLFAVVQVNNVHGAADYAYTVKVRFLNSAHPDDAAYTTLSQLPVQAGAMKTALASSAWKGDSAAMPKTCEVAKATKAKIGG